MLQILFASAGVRLPAGRTTTIAATATATTPATAASTNLVGFDSFVRENPRSDRFEVLGFHHVELLCGDAASAAGRFAHGLGLDLVARRDSAACTSVCARSGDVRFVFTAPGADDEDGGGGGGAPGFDAAAARQFLAKHGGLAVRAVAVRVADVGAAYAACVDGGATPVLAPTALDDGSGDDGAVAEVRLYGDVVLRLLSLRDGWEGAHLPGYAEVAAPGADASDGGYGIARFDHIVGNVWSLAPTIARLKAMTGFHEFAEFTAEDVGTVDSGLNSMVLASNDERVLLPVNEPTYGTRRRSQIQTYLVHHGGEGVQHIALFTDDIFRTVAAMRKAGRRGGFAFMDAPSAEYYRELPARIGGALEADALAKAEELGLLVDRDDQGVLIQVFTRPLGDRPTLFLEIIQRVGCMLDDPDGEDGEQIQSGGCGGFGKGNFKELFKSVEEFERSLELE